MRLFRSDRAGDASLNFSSTNLRLARVGSAVAVALSSLLVAGVASAAGDAKDKGSAGSAGPSSSGAGDSPGGGKQENLSDTRDRATDTTFANKVWEVGVGFEYHHTGLDGDYLNNDALRNVNYYSIYGRWDVSPYDRLSISWGVYQFFLADQGESGVRADDISLKYTRRIPLPGAVTMRLSASVTAPVSYSSQLAGLYTAPKFQVQADRRFGKYFALDARLTGGFYLVKFAEGGSAFNNGGNNGFGVGGIGDNGGGSNPNPKGSFTMALNGDFSMPFHTPLGIGLTVDTGYTWFYDVSNSSCPAGTSSTPCMYGTVMQPTSQPFEQSYASEVYVRYAFPSVGGFKFDLTATYAPNGDPTLGYASVLGGNGVAHVYPFYSRENAEVYFGLNARY